MESVQTEITAPHVEGGRVVHQVECHGCNGAKVVTVGHSFDGHDGYVHEYEAPCETCDGDGLVECDDCDICAQILEDLDALRMPHAVRTLPRLTPGHPYDVTTAEMGEWLEVRRREAESLLRSPSVAAGVRTLVEREVVIIDKLLDLVHGTGGSR